MSIGKGMPGETVGAETVQIRREIVTMRRASLRIVPHKSQEPI
jgi:hypothetical protein